MFQGKGGVFRSSQYTEPWLVHVPAHPPAANCIKWSLIGLCLASLDG